MTRRDSHSQERRAGAFRFASQLERRIVRRVGAAIGDYQLIEDSDHVLVAVSGGKDSLSLLRILQLLHRRSPTPFQLSVLTIHPGHPGFPEEVLAEHYRQSGVPHHFEHVPMEEILAAKLSPGAIPCSLCSRIRRGAIYTIAARLGCSKIALGHHLDDLIETLLMNLFFGGQLRSMAPRFLSDDGRNTVIRPLCYVPEEWLASYARELQLPATSCGAAGCGQGDTTRVRMKRLVSDLARQSPGIRWHALRALQNVRPEHLLDRALVSTPDGGRTPDEGDEERERG